MTFDASKELPRPSQRLALWVAAVGVGFVAGATYLAVRSSCVARDRGRGEGMGSRGGKLLYFNGQCWAPEPLPPADTRF
jgi:hypothetical protein